MQVHKGAASKMCRILTAQQIVGMVEARWPMSVAAQLSSTGVFSGGWVAACGLARAARLFLGEAHGLQPCKSVS